MVRGEDFFMQEKNFNKTNGEAGKADPNQLGQEYFQGLIGEGTVLGQAIGEDEIRARENRD